MAEEKKKKWIKAAVAEGKGKLHEKLGVDKDKKIPEAKLDAATHSSDPTEKKEAVLAKTMRGFNHKNPRHKLYGEKSK